MPEYSFILLLFVILGLALRDRYNVRIYKSTKQMIVSNIAFLLIGVVWDQFAIWRGHWSFGREFLLGPHIGYMPIEEYAFAIIMTNFILVLYRLIEKRSS